ncbi:MAG: hypothetical protein PHO57_10750 [Acidithiobacillus sp.]|nr:hypothetical protein [Acidithiobacillus sp.]
MSRIQELMTYPDLRVSIGSSSAVETEREIPQSPSSCSTLVRGNTEGAIVSGVCHGTLGELIQGPYLQGGELHISLISLPIKQYSVVHFVCGEDGDIDVDLRGKDKCRKAIDLYLARYQQPLPHGRWMCDSELLVGKGMASSTADIVATIRCLDRLFNAQSSPNVIAGILRELERSDSVFLDTYVSHPGRLYGLRWNS